MRLRLEKAVSVAEKYADMHTRRMMATVMIGVLELSIWAKSLLKNINKIPERREKGQPHPSMGSDCPWISMYVCVGNGGWSTVFSRFLPWPMGQITT